MVFPDPESPLGRSAVSPWTSSSQRPTLPSAQWRFAEVRRAGVGLVSHSPHSVRGSQISRGVCRANRTAVVLTGLANCCLGTKPDVPQKERKPTHVTYRFVPGAIPQDFVTVFTSPTPTSRHLLPSHVQSRVEYKIESPPLIWRILRWQRFELVKNCVASAAPVGRLLPQLSPDLTPKTDPSITPEMESPRSRPREANFRSKISDSPCGSS